MRKHLKKGPPEAMPKTRAELEHIKTEAARKGSDLALTILLYVLSDKFGWDTEQMVSLKERMHEQADAIGKGYVNSRDIQKVLREEYQIEV